MGCYPEGTGFLIELELLTELELLIEKWVKVNLMRFNETECRVLHLGCNNLHYQYRLGKNLVENSPAEKDLWCSHG